MADTQIQKTQDSNNPSNFQHIANNNQFNNYRQKNYFKIIFLPIIIELEFLFISSANHANITNKMFSKQEISKPTNSEHTKKQQQHQTLHSKNYLKELKN